MNVDSSELHWGTTRWGDDAPVESGLDPALMTVLLDHIATRVAVVDVDRRYRYANREALRFMGLDAAQVIGQPMAQVLDAGVLAVISPLIDRVFAGESLHRRGWADYERQGRRFREQWYVPYAPHGVVSAVLVCGLDHTEQRLSERELEDKRSQLQTSESLKAAIFDHALAALVSTDAAGLIVEWNPSAEAMFGRRRADVLGLPVSAVVIPERFREAHERGLQRIAAGGPPRLLARRIEMHALRGDGSEFPMEMVLWRTEAASAVVYTASIVDLSERHAAAQQIERQREALRQTEKLTTMGSLLAGVAHELNNPLAIVMGRASLLESKCDAGSEIASDALRIREAAERCGRIVRTFLDMARRRPTQRSSVALADVVRAAAELLGYAYRSHAIDLQLLLDPALPRVRADPDQLCQVVLNLLVNAQQALAAVEGPRQVTVSSGCTFDGVWLRVADNGPGLADAVRERIFESFFTTKAEGLGTGIGLSVSRALVHEHGGELVLEPATAGSGACFRLDLPIEAAAAPPTAPAGSSAAPVQEVAALARLLVVDDEAEIASMLRDMLEHAGYEASTAASGAMALEMLDMARFDAIVCDLHMPAMDGAALWREVSTRHPRLARAMLFMTGDTLAGGTDAFLRRSGCGCLDKPFNRDDLLARVAALLA